MVHEIPQHSPIYEWIEQIKQHPQSFRALRKKNFINKKVKIQKAICPILFTSQYSKQELIKWIQKNKPYFQMEAAPKYEITLDYHAWSRWNQRISPYLNWKELKQYLQILQRFGRIQLHKEGWGWIDQEIVFGYKLAGKRLQIQTFLGRVSIHPLLANYSQLLRYNYNQNDKVNLHVPFAILKHQKPPALPKEVYYFRGNTHQYQLQEYEYTNKDQSKGILWVLVITNNQKMQIIDPDDPFHEPIRRSALTILLKKGCEEFVLEHVAFFKGEKLAKVLEKYEQ